MKGERRKLEIRAESCYFEMGNEKPVGRSQYLPPNSLATTAPSFFTLLLTKQEERKQKPPSIIEEDSSN